MPVTAKIVMASVCFMSAAQSASPLLAEAAQTSGRPAFASYFEPPEASAISTELTARCGARDFVLGISSSERTTVRKFEFAGKQASAEQYRTLNDWIASLRGQVEVRVLCNTSGVKLVMTEAFNRDRKPRRSVDLDYVGGALHLN